MPSMEKHALQAEVVFSRAKVYSSKGIDERVQSLSFEFDVAGKATLDEVIREIRESPKALTSYMNAAEAHQYLATQEARDLRQVIVAAGHAAKKRHRSYHISAEVSLNGDNLGRFEI